MLKLVEAVLSIANLISIPITGNDDFALAADLRAESAQKPTPSVESEARAGVNVPTEDSFAIDLIHVLAAGTRAPNVRKFKFRKRNSNF